MRSWTLAAAVLAVSAVTAMAHCEIPCGIYNDAARFVELSEHVQTISKSMKQIRDLSSAERRDDNQIVRWIQNKEDHANKIQHIVTQYFMTQRIKVPAADDAVAQKKYAAQLAVLHRILVYAMKAKQSRDQAQPALLKKAIDEFRVLYVGGRKSAATGPAGSGKKPGSAAR